MEKLESKNVKLEKRLDEQGLPVQLSHGSLTQNAQLKVTLGCTKKFPHHTAKQVRPNDLSVEEFTSISTPQASSKTTK